MTDYERADREYPKQKARLTRAIKSGDTERIVIEVRRAIKEWDEWGTWPDGWHRWNVAYHDATGDYRNIDTLFPSWRTDDGQTDRQTNRQVHEVGTR